MRYQVHVVTRTVGTYVDADSPEEAIQKAAPKLLAAKARSDLDYRRGGKPSKTGTVTR